MTTAVNANSSGMLRGRVLATYLGIALPWTLATMANSSASVVDGIFVGRYVGANALAAVNMVMPLFALMSGICIVVCTGGVVKYAKYVGSGDKNAAAAIFTKSFLTLLMISAVFSIGALCFTDDLLHFLRVNQQLYADARLYLRIVSCFQAFVIMGFGLAFFVRVDGNPRLASIAVVGSALVNVVLDYLFVGVFGWGLAGAAYATGISFVFISLTAAVHFTNSRCHLHFSRMPGHWGDMFHAVLNGSSELLNELSCGFIVFLINRIMIEECGAPGVAAFAVINYLLVFGTMASFGFSDSLSPLISANAAAGKYGRSMAFLLTALATVLTVGVFLFILLTLFPQPLLRLFLPEDAAARTIALDFIVFFKWMFLLCGVNIVLTSYFTGMHRPLLSLITAGMRGFLLPLILVFFFHRLWRIPGCAAAIPVSELLTFGCGAAIVIVLNVRLLRENRALLVAQLPFRRLLRK